MKTVNGAEFIMALSLAPVSVYVCLYLVLRLCGKLSVGTRGWHAGSVYVGRCVVLSASRLFGWFEPLLRCESRFARRLARLRERPKDQAISEVVVEVIPLA